MASAHTLEIGDVLAGRYELVEEIGRGGFGVVYRATQLGMNRDVAVKLLHVQGGVQDDKTRDRFRREAMMARNLNHPHTIRQYDFGETEGGAMYLVLEYLDGKNLVQTIREEGALGDDRVRRMAEGVLKSLAEAHAQGIVHRDLKPGNIMLCNVYGEKDYVKVLDFGIAKTVMGDTDLTAAGVALGSPRYMGPEILRGDAPSPASDVYAVAITFGEAIIGKPIIAGDNSVEAAQIQLSPEPLPVPEELKASELWPWLSIALHKAPEDRYQDAEEMLQWLNKSPEDLASRGADFGDDVSTQQLPDVASQLERGDLSTQERVSLSELHEARKESGVHTAPPMATAPADNYDPDEPDAKTMRIDAGAAIAAMNQGGGADPETSPADRTVDDQDFGNVVGEADEAGPGDQTLPAGTVVSEEELGDSLSRDDDFSEQEDDDGKTELMDASDFRASLEERQETGERAKMSDEPGEPQQEGADRLRIGGDDDDVDAHGKTAALGAVGGPGAGHNVGATAGSEVPGDAPTEMLSVEDALAGPDQQGSGEGTYEGQYPGAGADRQGAAGAQGNGQAAAGGSGFGGSAEGGFGGGAQAFQSGGDQGAGQSGGGEMMNASTEYVPFERSDEDDEEQQKTRKKYLLLIAALGLLALVGMAVLIGAAVFYYSNSEPDAEPAPSDPRGGAPADPEAVPSESVQPAFVDFSIQTTPPNASVIVDGQQKGTTPTDFRVPVDALPMGVELRLAEHGTREIELQADGETKFDVELEPDASDEAAEEAEKRERKKDKKKEKAGRKKSGDSASGGSGDDKRRRGRKKKKKRRKKKPEEPDSQPGIPLFD